MQRRRLRRRTNVNAQQTRIRLQTVPAIRQVLTKAASYQRVLIYVKNTVYIKEVMSLRSGRFLLSNAMTLSRRKGPVGQLVATKDAPAKRKVEVYAVDMEAGQLAGMKDVPTMSSKEVFA